jgi:hypothetical protein
MRPSWFALSRADLPTLAVGSALTLGGVVASQRVGETLSLGALIGLTVFCLCVAGFIALPYLAVAVTIPTFALIPAIKVLAFPWIGPLKDVITFAAISAAAILVVQRAGEGHAQRGDFWVAAATCFLVGLYVLNLGGGMQRDVAWFQGVRLILEPLGLLLVGTVIGDARRTLRWALASLVATGVFVACVGILQQALGGFRLVELGYSWTLQVRTINGHLRSFGTMDEPFGYAAFLLLALTAIVLWMRRRPHVIPIGGVVVAGLAFSYVRSAVVVSLALIGMWLARSRRTTIAGFLVVLSVTLAFTILVWSSSATESRTVRTGPSLFLTINGRTEAWKVVLDDPKTWLTGKGVGEVGTAAERATYSVSRDERDLDDASAVDSGYFSLIADVGLAGLIVFLLLAIRLFALARRAIGAGLVAGWLAAGFLAVILLDAVTRDSFTGFPSAFLGMLLLGVALAAAAEQQEAPQAASRRR